MSQCIVCFQTGLNSTRVSVSGLSPVTTYTFSISSQNGVSAVSPAEDEHADIEVTTQASGAGQSLPLWGGGVDQNGQRLRSSAGTAGNVLEAGAGAIIVCAAHEEPSMPNIVQMQCQHHD